MPVSAPREGASPGRFCVHHGGCRCRPEAASWVGSQGPADQLCRAHHPHGLSDGPGDSPVLRAAPWNKVGGGSFPTLPPPVLSWVVFLLCGIPLEEGFFMPGSEVLLIGAIPRRRSPVSRTREAKAWGRRWRRLREWQQHKPVGHCDLGSARRGAGGLGGPGCESFFSWSSCSPTSSRTGVIWDFPVGAGCPPWILFGAQSLPPTPPPWDSDADSLRTTLG